MVAGGFSRGSDDPDGDGKEDSLSAETQQPLGRGDIVLEMVMEGTDPSRRVRSSPMQTGRQVLKYVEYYAEEPCPIDHLAVWTPPSHQYQKDEPKQKIKQAHDDLGPGVSMRRAEKPVRIYVRREIEKEMKPECNREGDPGPASNLPNRPTGDYVGCCEHESVYHTGIRRKMAARRASRH